MFISFIKNYLKLPKNDFFYFIYIFMISIKEAGKILGVSTKTLRRWEKEGKIKPSRTLGNHRRYDENEIIKLLKK